MRSQPNIIVKWAWRLVNVAAVLAICVVILGAWTRISNAGLSCPDWPGCYGYLVLPAEPDILQKAQQAFPEQALEHSKTQLEMGHRYLAGTLGVLIMLLAVCACLLRSEKHYPVRKSWVLLVLVIVQAVFGMWTVTLKLYPPIVTLHLLGGVLTLMLVLMVRVDLKLQMENHFQHKTSVKHAEFMRAAIGVLLIQIVLGGWTSSNYAGTACNDWLQCNSKIELRPDFVTGFNPIKVIGPNYEGGLLPVDARAAIQIGHRIGAIAVVFMMIVLIVKLYSCKALRGGLWLLGALLGCQLILGSLNAIYAVPASLAILHHSLAIILLVVLVWINGRLKATEVRWSDD